MPSELRDTVDLIAFLILAWVIIYAVVLIIKRR
jgi:hypothetical protein